MEDMVYNVTEVSKIIKTNQAYVYRLINSGKLKALKFGSFMGIGLRVLMLVVGIDSRGTILSNCPP